MALIGQREAEKGSWNTGMAKAYTAGLNDAKAGRRARSSRYYFPACYKQGYRHGKAEKAK